MPKKSKWIVEQRLIGEMAVGEIAKFICHWDHTGKKTCGVHLLIRAFKAQGKDYIVKCKDQIVYIGRIK